MWRVKKFVWIYSTQKNPHKFAKNIFSANAKKFPLALKELRKNLQ